MPSQTTVTLVRIADSPFEKTVTCFFSDNTSVVLESMSGPVNYTPPPGYGVFNADVETYKPLMAERYSNYIASLSAQALKDGINLQGIN